MNRLTSTLLISGAAIGLALGQQGQVPKAAGNAVKFTKWIFTVGDLEKSYAFYHEAFGFDLNSTSQIKKTAPASALLLKLTNSPEGSLFRNITTHSTGLDWNLEFLEFADSVRPAPALRLQDPGATYLRLRVRDIDKVVATALENGGAITSVGGKVTTVGRDRIVMLRDPDGHFIEVTQPDRIPADVPEDSIVIGGNFAAVVGDTEKAAKFYKMQFGLDTLVDGWNSDQTLMNVFGTPRARMRRASISVPDSGLKLELVQFNGIDSKPARLRIDDRGSAQLGLRVLDIDAGVAAFASHGGSVETSGEITKLANGGGSSFVRDMNGFLVELNQVALSAAN